MASPRLVTGSPPIAIAALVLLTALLLAVPRSAADGAENSDVLELTPTNFYDHVGGDSVTFVKFYAPWCGHCQRLAPDWEKVATAFKDSDAIRIAKVDCQAHAELCTNHEGGGSVGAVRCCVVLCGAVWCCAVLCCAVLYAWRLILYPPLPLSPNPACISLIHVELIHPRGAYPSTWSLSIPQSSCLAPVPFHTVPRHPTPRHSMPRHASYGGDRKANVFVDFINSRLGEWAAGLGEWAAGLGTKGRVESEQESRVMELTTWAFPSVMLDDTKHLFTYYYDAACKPCKEMTKVNCPTPCCPHSALPPFRPAPIPPFPHSALPPFRPAPIPPCPHSALPPFRPAPTRSPPCVSAHQTVEKLANIFKGEQSIVFAKVDADNNGMLAQRFKITEYPFFKFFTKTNKYGEDLKGDPLPTLVDLVHFVNQCTGTTQSSYGVPLDKVGRIAELDTMAGSFVEAPEAEKQELMERAMGVVVAPELEEHGVFYQKVMKNIVEQGEEYVSKEHARLSKLLAGSLKPEKMEKLSARRNILEAFSKP
ncbi:unnamed protein product [Closterium sp. NIES-54]